jgi:carboxymethylenebutenolidase
MTPNYIGSMIKPDDPRLKSAFITYDSPKEVEKIKDFYPNHRNQKKLPGIIVVHENRGLNPYIEM